MKLFRCGLCAAAVALLAAPALAQPGNAYYLHQRGMDERFRIDLGGFFQTLDTTLSLASSAGTAGTSINLEDLGQEPRKTSFAADGYLRLGRHSRLDFAYRGWSRSASHALEKDIVVGDTTYHVGAQVDSSMRTNLGELYYSYALVNNGDLEFGLGLGASVYFNSFEISGSSSSFGSTERRNAVAPIPALEAYFNYALYPRVFLKAAAKGISGTVNSYHGEMWDFRGGLDWFISQNVGVGGMYQSTTINFSHTGDKGDVAFDYKYRGPLAYVILAF
ncbi:MAG TPA: hypothetical protein VGM13_16755 [Thermoanaerobaculia bacterium]|jgi:hypothetical protein